MRYLHPFLGRRGAGARGLFTRRRDAIRTIRPTRAVNSKRDTHEASAPGPYAAERLEGRVLLAANPVLFTSDFEGGNTSGWRDYDLFGTGSISAVTSPAPVRYGRYSARFTLPAGSQRSELAIPADPRGAERWYAFSTFIPNDWVADPFRDILAQWHEFPDRDLGETWRIPPLSLAVINGNWQIADRWESKQVNNSTWNPAPPTGGKKEWYFPYTKGAWADWVFHIKWSYQSDGLLQVWQNGNQVINRTGPNTYNDETGNYFKLGLYHPDYQIDTHPVTPLKTIYHDEFRYGGENATYADVAPGRAPDPPIPSVVVNGTAGKDTIQVSQSGATLTVLNNGVTSTLSTIGKARLVVNGGDGDDTLLLSPSVTIDAVLNGGKGQDRLRGGAGSDEVFGGDGIDTVDYSNQTVGVSVSLDDSWNDGPTGGGTKDNVRVDVENIVGGSGNDTLAGSYFANMLIGNDGDDVLRDAGGERDVMIGGRGRDQLFGGGGEDLLIGSRTTYDGNFAALQILRAEWQRGTTAYLDRIARLRAGTPGIRIDATTVPDDGVADVLTGGTGKDWWVAHLLDTVVDRTSTETLTRL